MLTKALGNFAVTTLVLAIIYQKIAEASLKFCSSADSLKAELKVFCLNYSCNCVFFKL